jgi:CheY-like chemotaxis protein
VSELVAFIFTDRYRAPEVLNELRRRDGPWSQDLDQAVAITLDSGARASVHMSVDLSKREAGGWARIWGTLLNSTLFVPLTANGAEGIEMALSLRPDIIVLDLSMPGRNGLEVLREIRKVDQRVMIIIFTSDVSLPLRVICREAGANFFVTKPNLSDLLEICALARRTT